MSGDLIGYDEDWVGDEDDELIGEDEDDEDDLDEDDLDDFLGIMGSEIGARRRRRPRRKSRGRRAMRKAARRGVRSIPTRNIRGRLLVFGGVATAAGAGALDIVTTVQDRCRVDRLFLTGVDDQGAVVVNALFNVNDIKCGTKSQLTANSAIPAVAFQADNTAMMQGLGLDTLQPGTDFVVRIDSGIGAGYVFRFAAFATALR